MPQTSTLAVEDERWRSRPKALNSLQCARGIAAILVVYYHASAIADPSLNSHWIGQDWHRRLGSLSTHLPVFGKCGVDLFFVISGYIIWTSTLPRMGIFTFYKRRLTRVVPLYWLMTSVVALVLLTAPTAVKTMRLDWLHLTASLFFVPWPNPAFAPGSSGEFTPLLVAGWTLNFEMMFYLLFGFVVSRGERRLTATIWTFVAFAVAVAFAGRWIPNFRFYDPFLIGEFVLGCLIAALGDKLRCSTVLAITLLSIAFFCLLVLDFIDPPISRFFSLGIPAMVVIFALVQLERGGQWPSLRLFILVGDASYSIYLTHIIALGSLRTAWRPIANGLILCSVQEAFCISIVVLASCIGLVCFMFIERPLVRFAEGAIGVNRRTRISLPPENLALPTVNMALRVP